MKTGWIEENYPIGKSLLVPHPHLDNYELATITNHFNDETKTTAGVVARLGDGTYSWVGCGFLYEDGSGIQGNCKEETLPALAKITGHSYDTLVKAAKAGRLRSRQSGEKIYLSTVSAIEYAIAQGKMKPRS